MVSSLTLTWHFRILRPPACSLKKNYPDRPGGNSLVAYAEEQSTDCRTQSSPAKPALKITVDLRMYADAA